MGVPTALPREFCGLTRGRVVPSEPPDFLIKAQPRWIGIKLIEYHVQEPDEGWGSPMRALEGTEDKVLRPASRTVPVEGLVSCGGQRPLASSSGVSRRRIPELAAVLTNLVQEHLPETRP